MREKFRGKIAGFSTIEILIALAVLTLSVSAATFISFANQTLSADAETSNDALYQAATMLEDVRAKSRQVFSSAVSVSPYFEDIYEKELAVTDLDACTKQALSRISWRDTPTRPQKIELTTDLADTSALYHFGGDCGGLAPSGWGNPSNLTSADVGIAGIAVTGIDVLNQAVFMSAAASSASQPDFFVFDATHASLSNPPEPRGSLDTGPGLNAVDVISNPGNPADPYYYIFAANNNSTGPSYNQLQVLKVPKDFSLAPSLIAERTLPGVAGSFPQGRSLTYYSNYLYIGTHRTAGSELHIYDAADPAHPSAKGKIELDHNVNGIAVESRGVPGALKTYAFLATSGNSSDVIVLDVSVASAPVRIKDINVGGTKDATAVALVGNVLYLGKQKDSGPDFFAVDVSDPANPIVKASLDVPLKLAAHSITSIRVAGGLAFLSTTDSTHPFQVFDISNAAGGVITPKNGVFGYAEGIAGLDYEDDRIYLAAQSTPALRIVAGQ